MPITTPINSIPLPQLSDSTPPDIPADLTAIANVLDSRIIPRYATTTARNAAIPSPLSGMVAYTTGSGLDIYNGTAWIPIQTGLTAWSAPGQTVPGMITTRITANIGAPSTILTGPGTGRMIIKGLRIAATTAGTATLTLAGTPLAVLNLAASSIIDLDVTIPIGSGETLTITPTGGNVGVEATWGTRPDTVIDRIAYQSITGSSVLVSPITTARTISNMIITNTTSLSATVTVSIAGVTTAYQLPLSPGGFVSFDRPSTLSAAESITITATGSSVTCLVSGY